MVGEKAFIAFPVKNLQGIVLFLIFLPGLLFSQSDPFPYSTSTYNGLTWMTQNLYVDVPDSWCYDNNPANCAKYGRLYTWEAAKKACEELGWRLPTDDEWKALAIASGGYLDYGGSTRSVGSFVKGYSTLIEGGSSGFSAQLGGSGDPDGEFEDLGDWGHYWSATERDAGRAWHYRFHDSELARLSVRKSNRLSCRCVQGAPSNGND